MLSYIKPAILFKLLHCKHCKFLSHFHGRYKRTLMRKCDFNKAAKQLYWNRTWTWLFFYTHNGSCWVLLLFLSLKLFQLFSYEVDVLITNLFLLFLMKERFVIIFLICNHLHKCLRRVATIVKTTKSGQSIWKVIFTQKILTGSSYFLMFWCIPCKTTPEISISRELMIRVSRLPFRFLCLVLFWRKIKQNKAGLYIHTFAKSFI